MRRARAAQRSRAAVLACVTSLLAPTITTTIATTLATFETNAYAQSSSSAIVAAEALFGQGRDLMAQGKFAEACPKFADSQKLDPKSSTLLNLANCYEKAGRTATAWATYREAAGLAKQEGQTEYVATAVKRAEALYPKLSKMVVKVANPADGIEIRRDGVIVTPSEWGTAIPADPGVHVIEASAPKKESWKGTVEVPGGGGMGTIDVPTLKAVKEAPPPPPPPKTKLPQPDNDPKSSGAWRTVGWIVGGLGVVSAGVATGFVLAGKKKFDDSLGFCSTKTVCSQQGVDLRDQARSDGNVATALYVVGGAAIVTGAALILFNPPNPESPKMGPTTVMTVRFVPTLGGAALMGSF
jgi:hypothetical protein